MERCPEDNRGAGGAGAVAGGSPAAPPPAGPTGTDAERIREGPIIFRHGARRARLLLGLAVLAAGLAAGAGEPPPAPPAPPPVAASAPEEEQGPIERFIFYDLALMSLLRGAKNTLLLTVLAMPLAVLVGMVLASLRRSRRWYCKAPAAVYIEVIRGTPLLVQIFLVHFTLPQVGELLHTRLLTLEPFTTGLLCLAGNYAAYEAEIIRAGLEAVDPGQREAGLALGLSEWQSFRVVVLPQAFRIVVPPLINDLIAMFKDSCLVSVIGVPELLQRAQAIGRERATSALMMAAAAVIYLALSLACYFLGRWLERRMKVKGAHELHAEQTHGH